MIVQEEFLKKLRSAFDLNIYEVKIWTALLSRGQATEGELSDISNVPRSRSYDVLESLEKKGFIIMKLGKPIKYLAVKPEEIVKRLKKNIHFLAETRVDTLEKVRGESLFKDIELLYKQGIEKVDVASLSGAMKSRENIYDQMRSMLENAKKSVTIMTTADGFVRKADKFKNLLKKLSEKGIKIRIAAPVSKESKKLLESLKDVAQIKHIDSIKARFLLVDEKELLFMVTDDKEVHESYDTAVWVNTPYFANALNTMFEATWQTLSAPKFKEE